MLPLEINLNFQLSGMMIILIISSSTYGWREPIDNPNWGYGIREAF